MEGCLDKYEKDVAILIFSLVVLVFSDMWQDNGRYINDFRAISLHLHKIESKTSEKIFSLSPQNPSAHKIIHNRRVIIYFNHQLP